MEPDAKVSSLIRNLPDEQGPRFFLDRLAKDQPRAYQKLLREPALLSDALALAAWSPLLATTLEQYPEYFSWLSRERTDTRVRTTEQLKESLARFALTNSSLTPQVLLARFRRRELLRIYLHDVRRAHTLVETTEELSNLADAILDYALTLARQDLDNRYGAPLRNDERGRIGAAEFCIVALGKLGSFELNYASDIDLMFLYSDEGETASAEGRSSITNREYFNKLAETVAKLVGQPSGEGAAYRVDLRLRPYGRDGALACSLAEALKYYSKSAQAWELQALIRSRAAAGSQVVFSSFTADVQNYVYPPDISVKEALASVRLAKQKIDRQVERSNEGFNVKLQRGGIREIEFIAQALALAHGGRDEWLHAAHTLINLGRLADRSLITEQERSELTDSYVFLRMLEHRLQMEHGLQTHTVPATVNQRGLVARRMGYSGPLALREFENALTLHTRHVRQTFNRVFAEHEEVEIPAPRPITVAERGVTRQARSVEAMAQVFREHLATTDVERPPDPSQVVALINQSIEQAPNSARAIMMAARVAASLEKWEPQLQLTEDNLRGLIHLCGSSELFAETIASNPTLITNLSAKTRRSPRRDYRALLRASIDPKKTFAAELSALRREWSKLLIEIGQADTHATISIYESNQLQSELAIASINVAYLVARREMVRRYGRMDGGPRLAVIALGRLASGGVDYGSDLDLIIVFDSLVSSPVSSLTQEEAYARLVELMTAALSSVTREGYLYRVDLRLRPDGKNGPLVISSEGFRDYLRQRSTVWEWLAYVKLRAVAGDIELGKMIETHARHTIHEKATTIDPAELQTETRRVRERLEKEKGSANRRGSKRRFDIKYAAGGMLDVYFATRYLQLRDDIPDEGDDRSTTNTLARLEAGGSLDESTFGVLSSGYSLLRETDHYRRLILGKVAMPASDHPAFKEIARRLQLESAKQLEEKLRDRMAAIRGAYNRIMNDTKD